MYLAGTENIHTFILEVPALTNVCAFLCLCVTKVWQCGGSVEVLPCSRIAHIERAHKPYTENLTAHVRRNALRVAEVWMDQYKSHVYMAWNVPLQVNRDFDTGLFHCVGRCVCGPNCGHGLFVFRGCVKNLLSTLTSTIMDVHSRINFV